MKRILILFLFSGFFSCKDGKEVHSINKDIKELVFASGQLEWDNSYNLTAQTDGVLQNANFEVGNTVAKGTIIATIDNQLNQINAEVAQEQLTISNKNVTVNSPALQQLQQNIQFAESKYQQDKTQAARYARLDAKDMTSKVEFENAALAAKNSLANIYALKKQYAQVLQQAK